jgi:hypothetical protein
LAPSPLQVASSNTPYGTRQSHPKSHNAHLVASAHQPTRPPSPLRRSSLLPSSGPLPPPPPSLPPSPLRAGPAASPRSFARSASRAAPQRPHDSRSRREHSRLASVEDDWTSSSLRTLGGRCLPPPRVPAMEPCREQEWGGPANKAPPRRGRRRRRCGLPCRGREVREGRPVVGGRVVVSAGEEDAKKGKRRRAARTRSR